MPEPEEPSRPASPPADNAFRDTFLDHASQRDEPPTARQAEVAGSWVVRRLGNGYAVYRHWESPEHGDQPIAVLSEPSLALLLAAVLPARPETQLLLGSEPQEEGFPLLAGAEVCGHLSAFDEQLVADLNLALGLVSRPESLALQLQAAGATALTLAGRRAVRLGGEGAE